MIENIVGAFAKRQMKIRKSFYIWIRGELSNNALFNIHTIEIINLQNSQTTKT